MPLAGLKSPLYLISAESVFRVVDLRREMGIFGLKASFSGAIGNGSLLTPRPSFPDFGDSDPCRQGVFQRPLTIIILQKYRDTNGRRIVIQIGGVYIYIYVYTHIYYLLPRKGAMYFCKSIALEMGGVSRYFSKVSGSGVDSTLLIRGRTATHRSKKGSEKVLGKVLVKGNGF